MIGNGARSVVWKSESPIPCLLSCLVRRMLIGRGEEGDPVCLFCLEGKDDGNSDDRASDGNEMAHNTE